MYEVMIMRWDDFGNHRTTKLDNNGKGYNLTEAQKECERFTVLGYDSWYIERS